MFLSLLSLNFSTNKKLDKMMVVVEVRVDFELDDNKANKTHLELKIKAFIAIRFCFTSAYFLWLFSHWFFRALFIDQQKFSSSAKIANSQFKTLLYLYTTINSVLNCLRSP